jgi:hypothetical protein
MEVSFGTKEENNKKRQEAFLKLHPAERVMQFIRLSNQMMAFPTHAPKPDKGNFILERKPKGND